MPQRMIDACCLINLYATGRALDLLQSFEAGLFIPDLIRGESLFIRRPDDEDHTKLVPEPIDLSAALAGGWLHECRCENEVESEEFVRFATVVDDGEAICLALAKCRGWAVTTDDRKAIRVAHEEGIATVTTPELVKHWADLLRAKDEDTAAAIRNIERFARFRPRRGAPLADWWERAAARTGSRRRR